MSEMKTVGSVLVLMNTIETIHVLFREYMPLHHSPSLSLLSSLKKFRSPSFHVDSFSLFQDKI